MQRGSTRWANDRTMHHDGRMARGAGKRRHARLRLPRRLPRRSPSPPPRGSQECWRSTSMTTQVRLVTGPDSKPASSLETALETAREADSTPSIREPATVELRRCAMTPPPSIRTTLPQPRIARIQRDSGRRSSAPPCLRFSPSWPSIPRSDLALSPLWPSCRLSASKPVQRRVRCARTRSRSPWPPPRRCPLPSPRPRRMPCSGASRMGVMGIGIGSRVPTLSPG